MAQRHAPARVAPAPAAEHDIGLERIIFFSDAVFAIAITLLALEIRLPAGTEGAGLLGGLLAIWPKYLSFVISFLVIGMFWMSHHRNYRSIVRYDRRLMFLNLLLLLCVAFIPFPTALLGEYGDRAATIFYALTICATGLSNGAIWWYAAGGRGRLLAQPLPPGQLRASFLRSLITPTVFLLSIILALSFDSTVARLSWIATALVGMVQRAEA